MAISPLRFLEGVQADFSGIDTWSDMAYDIIYIGFVLGHGGDAIQMREIAAGMAKRGKRIKIVVPKIETTLTFAETCRELGVTVERSPLIHCDGADAKQNLFSLLRLLRTNRAPLIHLHTGDECLPRLVLIALRLLNSPTAIVTLHSPYAKLVPGEQRAKFWINQAPHLLQRILVPSQHSRESQIALGIPPELIVTINNSVDLQRFSSGDGSAIRESLSLTQDTPLVVSTSRLAEQKRPQDSLESFSRIAGEFPDAHLAFVGDGEREDSLRAAAQAKGLGERVHFVGYQINVQDWLAAATIWHFPTESENFSLALLEAMAQGSPILCSLCPGNKEALRIRDNRNDSAVAGGYAHALCAAVGDVEAQTVALRRLLKDSTLRQRLGKGARQMAQHYDIERILTEHEAVYEEALLSNPHRWSQEASLSGRK